MIRYLALGFIGMANALPLPLVGFVLTIWLTELGFDKKQIGLFALVPITLSFKILWAPIVDHVTLPFGQERERKTWLAFAICGMAFSLAAISFINPKEKPELLVLTLFFLYIFKGCLYVTGLAYELESIDEKDYPRGSAYVITGYRLGLLFGGAGALYFSELWDWVPMYRIMAALLALGSFFILSLPEPYKSKEVLSSKRGRYSQLNLIWLWDEFIKLPFKAFFQKGNWGIILLLLLTFKCGDELAKSMEGPFYLSLGFTKSEIATASKMWGLGATIVGAFLGRFILKNRDLFSCLIAIGFIHAASLICHCFMAMSGYSISLLFMTVAIENLTSGMAMTAFISFLWRVCDKQFAALQYTLLWSIFTFKADLLACIGGLLAAHVSWSAFFCIVTVFGLATTATAWAIIHKQTEIKPTKAV